MINEKKDPPVRVIVAIDDRECARSKEQLAFFLFFRLIGRQTDYSDLNRNGSMFFWPLLTHLINNRDWYDGARTSNVSRCEILLLRF